MSKRIALTRNQFAVVDDSDYEWLSQWKWYSDGRYAVHTDWRSGDSKKFSMHRVIMNAQPGEQVDHRNHDTLDNRRSNLRTATRSENQRNNKGALIKNGQPTTSIYKGVSRHRYGKWAVGLTVDHQQLHFGTYKNETVAARVHDAVASEYHGGFAFLNFPGDLEESKRIRDKAFAEYEAKKRVPEWQKRALVRAYEEVELSQRQLSRAFSLHQLTVKRILQKYGY